MDADINDVRRGIGHDSRIGFAFLFPGVGYGGSCFPKDVRALQAMARAKGVEPRLLSAVDDVNDRQKQVLFEKLARHFSERIEGRAIAVWGLAFKPRTDDIREAPALTLIDKLLARGADVRVHDPEAMDHVRKAYGDRLRYAESKYDALDGAEALAIMTEWKQFVHPDFDEMRRRMKQPAIFDGRNLFEPDHVRVHGFEYHSIGRAPVKL
jgi:UDPglucose 6-dehydrogenase